MHVAIIGAGFSGMLTAYLLEKKGIDVTNEEFLNNRFLQDSVAVLYMKDNKRALRRLLEDWEGREFKGVLITESGLLAAAHLVGSGNIWKWFDSDDPNGRTDSNGTSLRNYLSEFANYELRMNQ